MHRTSCGWTVTRDERTVVERIKVTAIVFRARSSFRLDDPVRSDRLVGPTIWGDNRSLRWPRVAVRPARVDGIRRPGPGAAHIHPSFNGCPSAAFDRCGFMDRGCTSHTQSAGDVSAQARESGMSRAFRRRPNDERAQHRTFARWCRPESATGHPGRHRAGWASRRLTRARSRAVPDAVSV